MSYQDRIDIDRLYDLIYDARSEQLKVVTREEFEQLFGSISSFKDMQELYYDKSEVYLKILDVLKEAGVITDEQYNELVSRIESVSTVANRADGNATNAIGTAGQALSNASDAYDLANIVDRKADDLRDDVGTVTGNDLQSQINTVDGKADDLRTDVGTVSGGNLQSQITTVDGKANDLRDDVGTVTGDDLQTQVTTANGNASTALSTANDAHDIVIYETTVEELGTIRFDVNQANSNASSAVTTASDAQTTANTANGNATTALSTANTADGKANQLRTDVGTVNQPTDGSLQQQITYLPAYISDLMVTQSSSTSEMGLPIFCSEFSSSEWYIGFRLTELAKKTIRDYGSITFTIKLNKPNNTTETITHTINNPSQGSIPNIVKIAYSNFLNLWGVTLITCENLKYIIIIGGVATKNHTHTISNIGNLQTTLDGKSDITHSHNISDVSNLQTSLDGKANSTHTHSISEVTNLQSSLDGKANSTHSHTSSEITDLTSSSETAFPYNSNATDYSTTNPVKITKWGRVITISGIMKLLTSVSANGDLVIGNMVSVLPSYDIYTTWTGINKQGFIKIATDGTVTLSNRNGTSTSMNSGEYFVFNCTYLI